MKSSRRVPTPGTDARWESGVGVKKGCAKRRGWLDFVAFFEAAGCCLASCLIAAAESEGFFEDCLDVDLLLEVDAAGRFESVWFAFEFSCFDGDFFARVDFLDVEFTVTAFFISVSSCWGVGVEMTRVLQRRGSLDRWIAVIIT